MATIDLRESTRRLRNAVEPVAAGAYIAPEAHADYEALGFDGDNLASPDGIPRPKLKSYVTSRGACMGQVTGEPHMGSGLTIDTAAELFAR
jgi:hypothetical protein